jgi:hypothetical protein
MSKSHDSMTTPWALFDAYLRTFKSAISNKLCIHGAECCAYFTIVVVYLLMYHNRHMCLDVFV